MCLMIDRLILSRIESLYESSKSSEGGQRRDCVIYSVPLSLLSINPTDSPRYASRPWRLSFLVQLCARAGKTLISRSNLCQSGSCRALRACPLWHLPSVSASAVADAKTAVKHHRPTHILPLEHHLICNLISRPKDSSQVVSIAKECILRLSPPDAFIEEVKFCNLLYDIYLLCGMDVLKTCNRLAWSLKSSTLCLVLYLIPCFLIVGRRWVM